MTEASDSLAGRDAFNRLMLTARPGYGLTRYVRVVAEGNADELGRPWPPLEGGEAATLLGFLDYQRATLAWKCKGLTDAQLRVALPPAAITLGGRSKHLAYVEDDWFSEVVGGEATPEPWGSAVTEADPDWAWSSAADDRREDLRALLAAQRARRSPPRVDRRPDGRVTLG